MAEREFEDKRLASSLAFPIRWMLPSPFAYWCSHLLKLEAVAVRRPDDVRILDLEPQFICQRAASTVNDPDACVP
jgi:hypothetical protein